MTRISHTLVLLALCVTFSSSAFAATIAGTVTNGGGSGLGNVEVQLWELDASKGLIRSASVGTNAGGGFTFTGVGGGTFRVTARLADGVSGNLTDRWFDVAEPVNDGWDMDSADDIFVGGRDDAITGIDIQLIGGGTAQGRVLDGGSPVAGMWVRFERAGSVYNHQAATKTSCCGERDLWSGRFVMRGLITGDDYRMMLYDPTGRSETTVVPGPFNVTAGGTADVGDVALVPIGDDPYEPNNSAAAPGVNSIPPELYRGESPSAFISEGALIGPLGGDVDWYCVNAMPHDRFIAYTSTDMGLPGEFVENPWLDPILSVWAGGTTLIASSDDGDGFGLNGVVDTGDIPFAGRYCFVVSSFGDTTWTGESQQTAGRYTIVVELGNRFPSLAATLRGGPVPPPPGRAVINEGEAFRIDFTYADPDEDELIIEGVLRDVDGAVIEAGFELTHAGGTGSFLWTVPDDAAEYSPFELTLTASDGEFTAEVVVLADPVAVNIPPFPPVPLSPENGETVESFTPTIVVENGSDLDGDPLTYDFELYLGDEIGDVPLATANITEGEEGTTSWPLEDLAENATVIWRARSNDSLESGVSEWTPARTFIVNTENEVAAAPELVKPDHNSVAPLRTPTLSASNTADPDGDTLWLIYEVATDPEFSEIVRTSEEVLQTASTRTDWTVTPGLEWGGAYYARVYAVDSLGNATEFSNTRGFTIKANLEPAEPGFGGDFATMCQGGTFAEGVPAQISIPAVSDPEGETLSIDLRVYHYDADVNADEPLFQVTMVQPASFVGEHVVDLDPNLFEENKRYLVRVQATDPGTDSDWGECDFYVNSVNEAPGPLVILAPTEGEEIPTTADDILIIVENATDPDGTPPNIRWCVINEFAGDYACTENPAEWTETPASEGTETSFVYSQYYDGAEFTLQACAMDAEGLYGPISSVSFTSEKLVQSVTPAFCGCGVSPTPAERAGWFAIAGLVFAGLRRRPRRA